MSDFLSDILMNPLAIAKGRIIDSIYYHGLHLENILWSNFNTEKHAVTVRAAFRYFSCALSKSNPTLYLTFKTKKKEV